MEAQQGCLLVIHGGRTCDTRIMLPTLACLFFMSEHCFAPWMSICSECFKILALQSTGLLVSHLWQIYSVAATDSTHN